MIRIEAEFIIDQVDRVLKIQLAARLIMRKLRANMRIGQQNDLLYQNSV